MDVVWSPAADRDLLDIDRYLAQFDERDAARLISRITAAAERLGVIPSGRPGRLAATFEKPVAGTAYILLYRQRRLGDEQVIYILRVVHMARDWPKGRLPPT